MLDRLMRFQDRRLEHTQQFHGSIDSAINAMRAHALLINFCPYDDRTLFNHKTADFLSPFERINGFRYRDNWLENLLVASSMRGYKTY